MFQKTINFSFLYIIDIQISKFQFLSAAHMNSISDCNFHHIKVLISAILTLNVIFNS